MSVKYKKGWNMAHKFKGFTLAEVLITLGLIGVIAALVMPALSISIETSKVETALTKAANTLSNAHMHMALDNEARDIVSPITSNAYLEALSGYIKGSKLNKSVSYSIDGTNKTVNVLSSDDGIAIIADSTQPASINSKTCASGTCSENYYKKFSGIAIPILVDTNGKKQPNLYGKDQFLFYIDSYGEVMPSGGSLLNNFNSATGESTTDAAWITSCESSTKEKPKTPVDCTASVVENGYKIKYAYRLIGTK